ncbi:glycerol-3-phosphate cytidylyltransferase [Shewanella donghaensis]|uniref:glycerol-3-phosphate cytidylyltransferase n=1 Tax=Shewanella donghaensis TaxID=238836 RepID=UPI001183650E|nr:glycerol-3-phosphate cytidylyltransferase [Shewanella donghaensis]
MKTIITYGTFDLFHYGHVRLFERLSEMCDELIVGVSTDEFNALKGKAAFFSFEQRAEIVSACRFVTKVIPEQNWQQKSEDVSRYDVDIFAIGDDWEGKFDFLKSQCEVLYLTRTDSISTTEIKDNLAIKAA